jgi:integration host factor subunit alpha
MWIVSSKTLTRADLAAAIQRNVGLSKAESADFVETIVGEMAEALGSGENVKISGFGSFVLSQKNERLGRNPKTGATATIPARKVLSFKASQLLKDQVARSK